MPGPTPWMGTITLPVANKPYQLLERLQALGANAPTPDMFNGLQFLTIQANEDGPAATKYFIGNSNMSSSMKGVVIYAAQVYPIYSMESNLIRWDHVYLMASSSGETFNVAFIQR